MSEVSDHNVRRAPRKLALWQRLTFSALALVITLGCTELSLRAAGVSGAPDRTTTWFANHILRPPLWSEHSDEGVDAPFLAAGQQHHFRPFAATKPRDAFRIAVFGGSAAHGYGMLEPAAFPHRLQQLLQRAVPDQEIQVINLGTIAWSSQQILWAGRQIFTVSDWDLVLVYSGHNELLELSSWKSFKPPAEHWRHTRMLLLNQRLEGLRIHQVIRSLFGQGEPPPIPQHENSSTASSAQEAVELGLVPRLDPIATTPAMGLDDLEMIPREKRARIGKLERDYAARTYRHNIGKLVALAQEFGVPSFLVNPAPNDFHDPAWFPRDGKKGARFNALMEQAEALPLHELAAREELSLKALKLFNDPRAMHLLGQSLISQGRNAEALPWLKEARRWAEYPNRVVPEVSAAILSFEGEPGVLGVLDGEALFRGEDGTDPIDYRFVYDHCHPSVEGNWLLAGAIADRLLKEPSLGLSKDPSTDLPSWTQAGQTQVLEQTERNPRLWEWTGLTFHPDRVEYIADAQGQWRERADQADRDALSPQADSSDWLWAGNYRFYDYRVGPALAAWTRALELEPGLCMAHANAAYALRSIGQRDSALKSASVAVECDPEATDFREERDLLLRLLN